jgi:Flp pilus assembly protein TadD
MYWATLDTGPDDLLRYQRAFGAPPDDPHFHRLRALAYERAGEMQEAQRSWEQFEKEIAAHPEVWPDGQGDRARALVWLRMGNNAVESQDNSPSFMPWNDFEPSRKLKPGADQCFRRSRDLAPDLAEPYEALLNFHLQQDHPAKAEQAARDLLQRFPEHARALEELSDLRKQRGDAAEALRLVQQALHANPLDRRLRKRVALAHGEQARSLVLSGDFEPARQELQSAGAFEVEVGGYLSCLRAALEFKAKNPAAEEALNQAAQACRPPLLLAYVMLVEAIRVKLLPAVKKRFDQEFKAGIAAAPDGQAAIALLRYLLALHEDETTYFGQKTHTKKILDYALRVAEAESNDDTVAQIVALLTDLESFRQAVKLARAGQHRFKANPFFYYFEALALLGDQDRQLQSWRIDFLLNEAERRARANPTDPKVPTLLDKIQERRQELAELDPFRAAYNRFMDILPQDDFEDDSFYDE